MKTIIYSAAAARSFDKLAQDVQAKVAADLDRYAMTGHGDVKRLQGVDLLRLRSGNFRVLFTETAQALLLTTIADRRAIYR